MSTAIDGKEAIVVDYILPSVGSGVKLDRRCPHCGDPNGRIHSSVRFRRISDPKATVVAQRRMRCPRCGVTWALRSEGVCPGCQRSDRLIGLGVILYMLGLSYRGVAKFLPCLGCRGSRSAVDRDVASAGSKAQALHDSAPRMRVRVLGVDGTGDAMAGTKGGLLFYADVERGKLVCVEAISETDAPKVRRHVRRVFSAVGAEELRTDEHSVYEGIVPEGRHRLCLTHWLKSKGKRAADLGRRALAQERPLEAESMRQLLALLRLRPRPPTVPEALERLVMRYSRCRKGLLWKINQLLQHVERTWAKVSDDPVDATNNATERMIGLTYKIRTKTMRGMKSRSKVLSHPYLTALLRGDADGRCDLRDVI
jgi:transposase-like protein